MAANEAEESKTVVVSGQATDFSQGGDQWPTRTQTMVVVKGGNLAAEQEDKIAKARQTVNVYDLSRGSLARLGMDPAEIRLARERAHEIKFALKYDRRRSEYSLQQAQHILPAHEPGRPVRSNRFSRRGSLGGRT